MSVTMPWDKKRPRENISMTQCVRNACGSRKGHFWSCVMLRRPIRDIPVAMRGLVLRLRLRLSWFETKGAPRESPDGYIPFSLFVPFSLFGYFRLFFYYFYTTFFSFFHTTSFCHTDVTQWHGDVTQPAGYVVCLISLRRTIIYFNFMTVGLL